MHPRMEDSTSIPQVVKGRSPALVTLGRGDVRPQDCQDTRRTGNADIHLPHPEIQKPSLPLNLSNDKTHPSL